MKRISIVFIALLHITAICRGDVCPVGYQPAEYQILEYIESTGTQYIDTGVSPTLDTVLELKGIQGAGDCALFGVAVGMYAFNNAIDVDLYTGFNGSHAGPFAPSLRNTPHIINMSKIGGLIVDGATITSFNNIATDTYNSMFLFARRANDGSVQKQGYHRIYYTKIWDNDTLVRDFIPVRRLADGVLGMYDTVTDTFFTNAGTGTFIAGPETYETIYGNGAGCAVCPPNTYKDTAGDFPCTPCPSTTFSKSGSTSINDCGHVMHVGDKIYFLNSQKLTSPALHVRMPDGTIYYGSLYSEME